MVENGKKPTTHNHKLEPITLIVTCYNEESTVAYWCESFLLMEVLPKELIIADSDSNDATVSKLHKALSLYPGQLIILEGKCNIAAGRNKAIATASHPKIAITDFGVTFHPEWLKKISITLDSNDWVGGVYEIVWSNPVEESFCRLFNKPVEKIDASSFLPSSRSFGLTRKAFETVGGYDESLAIAEDTDLVLRLKKTVLSYELTREAIVYWKPRPTIESIYIQNFQYSYWDGVALQNLGRLKQLAFCMILLAAPTAGAVFFYVQGLVIGFSAALAILFLKTNKIRRSCSGLPRSKDMLVYAVTSLACSVGYISGFFLQELRKASTFEIIEGMYAF